MKQIIILILIEFNKTCALLKIYYKINSNCLKNLKKAEFCKLEVLTL